MSDPINPNALLGEAVLGAIRRAIREELQALSASAGNGHADNGRAEFLTVNERTAALKVPKSWLYDRTRRRKDPIPHVKVGRYPRFKLSEVIAWLDSKKHA